MYGAGNEKTGTGTAVSGRRRIGLAGLDVLICEALRLVVAVQMVGLVIALKEQFPNAQGRSDAIPE